MLPSGNDAAIALAEHFGNFLIEQEEKDLRALVIKQKLKDDTSTSKDIQNVQENDYIVLPEIKPRQERELSSESAFRESQYSDSKPYGSEFDASYSIGDKTCSVSYSESFTHKDKFKSFFKDSKSISRFLKEMNSNAKRLKMTNTNFDSPHGLANKNNISTAYDIALLCTVCIKNIDFSRISRTKLYV